MDYFSELVKTNKSELARHLHHDLYGLCASLQSALQQAKFNPETDPGIENCERLIEYLNQLLQEATSNKSKLLLKDDLSLLSNCDNVPVESSTLCGSGLLILEHLRNDFISNATLRSHIGDLKLKSTSDSELWGEIQRLLLRLSERVAKEFGEKALQLVQQVGVEPDPSKVVELPFDKEFHYPGLKGKVEAQGLHLSPKANLDERIVHGRLDSEALKFLAQVVSICLHFVETDLSLQHCLKSVHRFGLIPLESKQKSSYIKTLLSRFQRVQESEDDPVTSLKARLDLDEAIHSLVYLPPVDDDSWWGKMREAARKTLEPAVERVRQERHDVGIQWLLGAYDNINQSTQDDVPLKIGGNPGKVLVCLRIYAWIDQEKILGRVIFCPK
jgi:hypothetical protein